MNKKIKIMVHNPFFFFRHIGSNGAEVRERPALGMGTLWWREQLYDMGNRNGCRI